MADATAVPHPLRKEISHSRSAVLKRSFDIRQGYCIA
jgi:hypothetical protein